MQRNKSSNRHACEDKELGMPNASRVKPLSANGQLFGTLLDTSEPGGYKSSPGDNSYIDTYWLRAIILLAPVDSEGASLKGSLGSLLFGQTKVRPPGTFRC
jgi:hypothetical protein